MGSWATPHIERLQKGETVQFRPVGGSMRGKVNSGDLVTVEPLTDQELKKGMIVLCKVKGNQYLHLIKAIEGNDDKRAFQSGNNKGGINGWVMRTNIYGVCTKVGE